MADDRLRCLVPWLRCLHLLPALSLIVASSCAPSHPTPGAQGDRELPRPPRPAVGTLVTPDTPLQEVIDAAKPGSTLILAAGRHQGPVKIRKPLILFGPPEAVVASTGSGSTIEVTGDGVSLLGFCVDGSGARFDLLDAAVRVSACNATLDGLRVQRALFGILVEKSTNATIRNNRVVGSGQSAFGLRGDGIRLWETRNSRIEGNLVTDSRDVVVWYSANNRVADNEVRNSRYGTHFMYSHENVVEGNRYIHNVVGVFVMYSRDVTIRRNLLASSTGAAGVGLGIKESGNLQVHDNDLLRNTVGIYIDTSPLDLTHHNRFERNQLRLSATAVVFHASAPRNHFLGNSFRDNQHNVRVDGGGNALTVQWLANHFDDYQGYDLDTDGTGDLPYQLRSLSGELTGKYPELSLFRGSPTLALLDISGQILPLFEPRLLLTDPRPAMQPLPAEGGHAR